MFVFAMFLMVAPCICVKGYTETSAFSIITTSGWFFFVLINAYYGGALTMFFVSEITLPFNTIRDALRARWVVRNLPRLRLRYDLRVPQRTAVFRGVQSDQAQRHV